MLPFSSITSCTVDHLDQCRILLLSYDSYVHLSFNKLGLTLLVVRLKLWFIDSYYRAGPHHERRHYSHPASQQDPCQ
ncbi:hypothetical protein EMIT0P44_40068 [Pseudomonas sp. IT-P44]